MNEYQTNYFFNGAVVIYVAVHLRQANIQFDDENQSLKDIARENDMSPQQVFLALKPAGTAPASRGLPPNPPPGTGNQTLVEFSAECGFDIQWVLKSLSENNIAANAHMTIEQVARQNDMAPTDVYILLREIVQR